ncbi:hypothetical protein ACGFNU_30330 [Spirillospora sp. NPDC048911]|uniref:hypothetical protein n=1 Tax=Spirillospora sp. NPDC048911 TaxID=3364527 RepID=UPI003714C4A1
MTALIRSYALGLHTLRGTYGVAASLIALGAVMTGAGLVAGGGVIVALGLSLFAAARVGGEFRHGTITLRFLAGPRRAGVLAAALITYGTFALLVGTASLGAGIGIAWPLAAEGLSLGLSPSLIGAALLTVVLFALIGVCAGAICRDRPAAVLVIAGAFAGEQLAGRAIGDAAAVPALAGVTAGLGALAACLVAHRDIS